MDIDFDTFDDLKIESEAPQTFFEKLRIPEENKPEIYSFICNDILPEDIKTISILVDEIFLSEHEKQEIEAKKNFISYYQNHINEYSFFIRFFEYISNIQPKKRSFVLSLIQEIFSKFPEEKNKIINYVSIYDQILSSIFVEAGFLEHIKEKFTPIPNVLTYYPKDSAEYFVKEDLIDDFQIFLSNYPLFDINCTITNPKSKSDLYSFPDNLINLACFYGSINCFIGAAKV